MQSSGGGERKLYVEIKENNTFSGKSLFQQNETREEGKKKHAKEEALSGRNMCLFSCLLITLLSQALW